MHWDVRYKTDDLTKNEVSRVKSLGKLLQAAEDSVLEWAPVNTSKKQLRKNRIRVYNFSRKEGANELFFRYKNKKYVCLNAALLRRRYWAALQYLIHGLAHSFCHIRDGIGEEVFCEHVGFEALKGAIKNKGTKLQRRIVGSVVRTSHPSYRAYFRAARRLSEKDPEKMYRLNMNARHRKISKSSEKRIIYRALKARKAGFEDTEIDVPELEKGFRKI